MELGVRDRAYVVFGGTRGIGFAAANTLVADGATVAVVGRDAERAEHAAKALNEGDGRAIGVAGDLRTDGEAERVLAFAEAHLGPLRGVAITTGLGIRGQRTLLDSSDADWTDVFDDVLLATV